MGRNTEPARGFGALAVPDRKGRAPKGRPPMQWRLVASGSVPRTRTAPTGAKESPEPTAAVLLQSLPANPLVMVEQPRRILVRLYPRASLS